MNLHGILLAAIGEPAQSGGSSQAWIFVLIILLFLGVIIVTVGFNYGKIWVQAYFSQH